MGQSESYSIRELGESDKNNVFSIRSSESINRGCDYLPDYYDMLIKAKNTEGFIMKCQDKYIAVAFFSVVDDKKTVVLRAYRIHPDFVGRRLIYTLTCHAIKKYRLLYNIKQYYFLTKTIYVQEKIEKKMFQKLVVRKKLAYVSTERTVNFLTESKTPILHQDLTARDLDCICQSEYLRSIFFKNDIFIAFLVPYQALQSNVAYIMNERSHVIASGITDETKEKVLSYGEYSRCDGKNLDYYVDLYGVIDGSNENNIKSHIKSHITKCLTLTKGKVHMFIYVNDDVNTNVIDDTLNQLGMSKDPDAECVDAILKGKLRHNAY